jgi:predicted flap endonuclease-1-like 5' DNA nuclease
VAKIIDIEGVGTVAAKKLSDAGIKTTQALLKRGGSPTGRREIAQATGLDTGKILEWVNHADLMRIRGVGSEYSDLLEAAGVDTVKELATRRADNLHARLLEVNASKKLVRRPPSRQLVEGWVTGAKSLPQAVTH